MILACISVSVNHIRNEGNTFSLCVQSNQHNCALSPKHILWKIVQKIVHNLFLPFGVGRDTRKKEKSHQQGCESTKKTKKAVYRNVKSCSTWTTYSLASRERIVSQRERIPKACVKNHKLTTLRYNFPSLFCLLSLRFDCIFFYSCRINLKYSGRKEIFCFSQWNYYSIIYSLIIRTSV